ncbi:MAG: hypothetical protein WBO09_00805 [Methylocystis silviterrae]|uniref:hypothetical protein n=1 Tax=Methylocystis silviterrae TaxID=2743612 RepID=UPI003C71C683
MQQQILARRAASFGALGFAGQRADIRRHGESTRRIVLGAREHHSGVASQKQNLRCLDRLIGDSPVPGSLRVTRADGAFHGGAQGRGVDDPPFGEMDDERLRAAIPSACGLSVDMKESSDSRGCSATASIELVDYLWV